MASPFTPLLDPGKERYDDPSFMNTPQELAAAKPTPKQNPVIPKELATLEDNLKAEGSGTSTLGHIIAWAGAAKGDFRGLQTIEDSKRRTALAKSIVPEIGKVNALTTEGKWEEASDYVNKLVGSYGLRADYLVPYFTQMQADIKKKQEGWQNLKSLYDGIKASGVVDENNVNYPMLKALEDAVQKKNYWSETNLQGFMTRYGKPETQVIDGRVTRISPLGGPTQTEYLPAISKASDFTNFAGNTVASGNNLNTKQLADLHNGLPVKNDKGQVIQPDSKEAQTIKTQFNALQPINARLEMAALAQIPPEVAVRLLQKQGLLKTAIRDFGEDNIVQQAYDAIRQEDTAKQIAINKGTEESSYSAVKATGKIPFDLDTFSDIKDPLTVAEIKNSRGRIVLLEPTVINDQIKPALAEIENLSLIPGMFENKDPQTIAGRAVAGGAQIASSYLGFPLNKEVETRQRVKTMLRRAIETVENTPELGKQIVGKDSTDLKDLKAYAAGNFNTPLELIKAADTVTQRLQQVLRRAVAGMESSDVTVTPKEGKPRTPAEVLAPIINKAKGGRPQQSQITQQPYDASGKLTIPGELDPELQQKIQKSKAESLRTGKPTGGAARVQVPTGVQGQPTLGTPTPQGYNEDDVVQKAMQQKRQQRMK